MRRFYHNSDGLLMLCVQSLCVESILISLNQFWQNLWYCLYHLLIGNHQLTQSEWGPGHIQFYNQPLSWQTAQTLMRCSVSLFCGVQSGWIYAVCIYSIFEYNQPVTQMRTLNFRRATPLTFSIKELIINHTAQNWRTLFLDGNVWVNDFTIWVCRIKTQIFKKKCLLIYQNNHRTEQNRVFIWRTLYSF